MFCDYILVVFVKIFILANCFMTISTVLLTDLLIFLT